MIDTPEVFEQHEVQTVVIALDIPRTQMREVMGPAIGEVMNTLAAQGVAPAGPLFTYHPYVTTERFTFEVGFPVDAVVLPTGRVVMSRIPATRAVRTIYHGPYEGLGNAWQALDEWMLENGHTQAGGLWERYLSGPESGLDASEWRTELNHPVA